MGKSVQISSEDEDHVEVTDDEFIDEDYVISKNDLLDEKSDEWEDGAIPSKVQSTTTCLVNQILNISTFQRKKQSKNTTSQRRAKRTCTEAGVERFGTTEDDIDHNSFFDTLESTNTNINIEPNQLISTSTNNSSDIIARFQNNEKDDLEINATESSSQSTECLLKLLIAKVDALQEQMVRMEVKIENIKDFGAKMPTGVLDVTKLNRIGLPVKSLDGLKSLESVLNDNFKRAEFVSRIHVIF